MKRETLRPLCADVIIVGAGRNAHNMICAFEEANVKTAAVLDDACAQDCLGYPVRPIDSDAIDGRHAIMSVTDPELRARMIGRDALRNAIWTTFVDPSSVISRRSILGCGIFVGPFSVLVDVVLADHVSVMTGSILGARVEVGECSVVSLGASVASDCRIGKGVVIGMGARIHAGVAIGDGCRIASNTVVRRDLPARTLAFPAGGTLMRRIGFGAKEPPSI